MIVTAGVILSHTFISGWFSGKKKGTEITDEKTRLVFEDMKKRLGMENYEIDLVLGLTKVGPFSSVQSEVSISGKNTIYMVSKCDDFVPYKNVILRELIRIKLNHDVKARVTSLAIKLIFGVSLTALWGVIGILPALVISYFVAALFRDIRQKGLEAKVELQAAQESTPSELNKRIEYVYLSIKTCMKLHQKEVKEAHDKKKRWKSYMYNKDGDFTKPKNALSLKEILGILHTESARKIVDKTPD